ncbi:MAG: ABC transporter permease [Chloroflexi bacterium]|nr:ABC transporter permease [Chloroflexota bacterium]
MDKTLNRPVQSPAWQFVSRHSWIMPILSFLLFIGIWQLLYSILKLPAFILPSPALVWAKFVEVLNNGMWWRNLSYTLLELSLGLLIGTVAASALGYILSKTVYLEKLLSPFLVGSQSVPVVAIAPLIIIWFGPGLFSKVLICALTVFFPVLVNVLVGMRQVSQDLRELMSSFRATGWQTLRYLEFPAALPVLLGGLRVGATLSVIGAIVGELVGSDRGLGYLINLGRGQYDTTLVFVAVFSLIFLAASLYALVLFLERRALKWQTWRDF